MAVNKYRLLSSLIVLLAVTGSNAQDAPQVPSLVVNIVIDQLRSDYLDAFTPLMWASAIKKNAYCPTV